MTICSLGADEWKDAKGKWDPTKIPVAEILVEWRAMSERGRYEGREWSAAALEQARGVSKRKARAFWA